MYNCESTWHGQANPILGSNGLIRVLEVSQFVPKQQIEGKVWADITLDYSTRSKFVRPGDSPLIGSMYYTIDADSGVFRFLIGTVDSSG